MIFQKTFSLLFFLLLSFYIEAESIFPGCYDSQCETVTYVCNISRDLVFELKNPYQNFTGWFHLNAKFILPKNSTDDFYIIDTYNGIDYLNSSCPIQYDPSCPYNLWTFSSKY